MSSGKPRPKVSYNRFLNKLARGLRNESTVAERKFWRALRQMPFYPDTVFNRQKPIGNYIVDFYCHQLKLVVEIDGDTHGEPATQASDALRTAFLNQQGLTVIRYTNPEVLNNIEGVMADLEEVIENKNLKSP